MLPVKTTYTHYLISISDKGIKNENYFQKGYIEGIILATNKIIKNQIHLNMTINMPHQ